MIHADFETRSAIDLKKVGAYRYAQHPTTGVNCLGWAVGNDDVDLWLPGMPPPKRMIEAINDGELIAAWNAQFERLIWNWKLTQYGFPPLPIERFYCVAALARARGYPGALDKAMRFDNFPISKDMEGHYLMLKLCRPRRIEDDGTIVWWDDPRDFERLGEYCKQDVIAERARFHSFVPFTPQELAAFHMSERINDLGVHVDVDLARAAVLGAEKENWDAAKILTSLTDGAVTAHTQVAKIRDWVADKWKELPDLNKTTIYDALVEEDIPEEVSMVLQIRLENARAAISKFDAALARQNHGVVQGLYMFRGAGQTGRYTSMGLQIQNTLADSSTVAIDVLKKRGMAGLKMLGDPVQLMAQMVRPMFIPAPGNVFLIGDYKQIEARLVAFLSGEEKLLKVFRDGGDPYCAFGSIAYGRPITKADVNERKASKACVLGLGFGGAEGALARGLKKEGLVLPKKELTNLVGTFRESYSHIKRYWYVLRDAALKAMYGPGTIVKAGLVAYLFDGQHLWCKLPSDRLMCYPFARLTTDDFDNDAIEYRRGNRSPKAGAAEWPHVMLWYGMQMENIAQAIALDLLTEAQERLDGWKIPIHVHDELVAEVFREQAEIMLPEFGRLMGQVPDWIAGLPVEVDLEISERYK